MSETLEEIVGYLIGDRHGPAELPVDVGPWLTAGGPAALSAAFLIALGGPDHPLADRARAILEAPPDGAPAELVELLRAGVEAVRREIAERAAADPAFARTLTAAASVLADPRTGFGRGDGGDLVGPLSGGGRAAGERRRLGRHPPSAAHRRDRRAQSRSDRRRGPGGPLHLERAPRPPARAVRGRRSRPGSAGRGGRRSGAGRGPALLVRSPNPDRGGTGRQRAAARPARARRGDASGAARVRWTAAPPDLPPVGLGDPCRAAGHRPALHRGDGRGARARAGGCPGCDRNRRSPARGGGPRARAGEVRPARAGPGRRRTRRPGGRWRIRPPLLVPQGDRGDLAGPGRSHRPGHVQDRPRPGLSPTRARRRDGPDGARAPADPAVGCHGPRYDGPSRGARPARGRAGQRR